MPVYAGAANIDPSFEFSTIETEHFLIHYHQGLEEIGKKTAVTAEEIHNALIKDFKWSPGEKTQLVLIDDTDFANAFASVLPYNTIYIQVVPPMPDSTIGEYDDWLKLAITHEYAHILSMDSSRGYSEISRKIFGKPLPGYDFLSLLVFIAAVPPNVLLPDWSLEGMSTWAETEHTNSGRGRSAFYEMIFRMAVEENNIPTVDKINGDVPDWPDGHMPYIYGLRLHMHIVKKYGKNSIGNLSLSHAGRFPYFINGAPTKLFFKNYAMLYAEMVNDLKEEQSKKIELLKQSPLTNLIILNTGGEKLGNPRFSPDNNFIALNKRDPHEHESIIIVDKTGRQSGEVIRRLPSDHNITWSKDGGQICFTQAEIQGGFNLYQDIYCYIIKDNDLKRITKGLRAKDADLSPDNKTFAFIKVERGVQNLAFIQVDEGEDSLKVVTNYKDNRLSNPRWSSDGNFIVFSAKDNKGNSSLQTYDIKNKIVAVILEDKFNNLYPVWSPDGRSILFTSDRTGVFNLFAYSVSDKKIFQATHVLGGAFQPDISNDGKTIIFSSYHSKGFKIATIDYKPEAFSETIGPVIKPYWEPQKKEDSETPQPASSGTDEPKAYSALSTLAPRFWLPTLIEDHKGAVGGIFTAGQDVLGYHTYIFEAGYGFESTNPYFDLSYYYDRLYPTFFLRGYSRPVLYSDFFENGDYYERQSGLAIGIAVPINYVESRYSFIIGYHLKQQRHLTALTDNKFEGIEIFEGRRDNVFAGIEFSNALRYPYSISREEGRKISLYYRNYSKSFGSDVDSREYIGTYQEYLNLSFFGESQRHSVLYTKLKGAISGGERISQQSFQLGGYYLSDIEFPLRGYPSRFKVGKYITTGTLEYRSPIKYIFKGWNTKPFFMDRLHGALFVDAGNVWDDQDKFEWRDVRVGVGAELRLDMVLGYKFYITPALGVATGLDKDGETQVYFTIYAPF